MEEALIDSMDYFVNHILVEGKPLTSDQKDRYKKEIKKYEKLPAGRRIVFGKRRR